jgi:pimeloyl-ACP methyl ester carboxylesterase
MDVTHVTDEEDGCGESRRADSAAAAAPSVIAEYADLPPHSTLVVQLAAGHFPWLDDPDAFVAALTTFLG